jgi:hypothetical protein
LVVELGKRETECVRTEWPGDRRHLIAARAEPHPAQPPRVAIDEAAIGVSEAEPDEPTEIVVRSQPLETAGHAEVEEKFDTSGAGDQPLAAPLLGDEGVPDERARRCSSGRVAHHRWVNCIHRTNSLAERVVAKRSAVSLDIGELGHADLSLPDLPQRGRLPSERRMIDSLPRFRRPVREINDTISIAEIDLASAAVIGRDHIRRWTIGDRLQVAGRLRRRRPQKIRSSLVSPSLEQVLPNTAQSYP